MTTSTGSTAAPAAPAGPRRLIRPTDGRLVAGVAAAVADYLDADVTVVRLVLAALAVLGGAGVPLYLAGWLLIPAEDSDRALGADLLDRARSAGLS